MRHPQVLVFFLAAALGLGARSTARAQASDTVPALANSPAMPRMATVPFTLDHNRMFVEVEFVRPGGTARKARAWVDTGSETLTLVEPLARDLGLDCSGLKQGGAGDSVHSSSPAPPCAWGACPSTWRGSR